MSILDILYPKRCINCKTSGAYFCSTCVGSSKLHFPQVCPVCERASVDGVTHTKCKKWVYPDGLTSIWDYQAAPKKAILKLKYKFVSGVVEELAQAVVDKLKNTPQNTQSSPNWKDEKFIIVSIPLHWTRQNWRGFNHAQELAKAISSQVGWECVDMLSRKTMTKSQVGLGEEERKKNIEGVFSMNPNITSKNTNFCKILLFDDVWTTGSTMLEATKVLKEAGFRFVWCLTLAR